MKLLSNISIKVHRYIEGRIQTRKWQDQNGHDRYSTEIIADQMTILDSKGSTIDATKASTLGSKSEYGNTDDIHDDITLPGENGGKDDSGYWDEIPF